MIRPTILLADNDSDYRGSLGELLEGEGFVVEQAASIDEAKTKLDSRPLDLALVDLHMTNENAANDLSGLSVAKKALERQIPCLVITALPSIEATIETLRAQGAKPPLALDFILKKLGPVAILQAMKKVPFLNHFAILHISDLHFLPSGEVQFYDQERSRRAIIEDINKLRHDQVIGRIKAIIISGDIAYKGREDSYDAAWFFLRDLCNTLQVDPKEAVLVPGNHDLDRLSARTEWTRLPPSERENSSLFSKFGAFLRFSTHFYDAPAFTPDKLYKIFDFDKIAILALNSCYRDGNPLYRHRVRRNEYYPGWINEEQVTLAIREMETIFSGRDVLRLAVCHHHVQPEGKFQEQSDSYLWNYNEFLKYTLAEANIHILLHGHGHRTQLSQPPVPGTGMPYTFGSGTLLLAKGPKATYNENQYLIVDFGPTSRLIMRKYVLSEGNRLGAWTEDNGVKVGGILELPDVILPA